MREPLTTPAVKFIRLGIAISLVVLTAAVVFYSVSKRHGPSRSVQGAAGLKEPKVDVKEGLRYQEYQHGKVRADVRARRSFLGSDGLTHLEGGVEVLDYGNGGGPATRIVADEVAYDLDMMHFTISGRASVHTPEIEIEAPLFAYDKKTGSLKTDQGGTFTSGRMTGSAQSVFFDERRNEVRLSLGFRVDIRSAASSTTDVTLSGDSFFYRRNERAGEVKGRARVSQEHAEATSDLMRFELTEDEMFFKSMALVEAAKFDQAALSDHGSGRLFLEAESIRLDFRSGSFRASNLEARGDCVTVLTSPPDPGVRIKARRVRMAFNKNGGFTEVTAGGVVHVTVEDESGETRNIDGDDVSYGTASRALVVRAGEGRTAALDSLASRIEAPVIRLEPGSANIEASGGVKCLVKSRAGKTPIAFFAADAPVFITAQTLTVAGKVRRDVFSGAVRVWQEKVSVQAEELEIPGESGEIRCRGGVIVGFPDSDSAKPDGERTEVGGGEMTYAPEGRRISFQGTSFITLGGARLRAASVVAWLKTGTNELGSLSASGSVVVDQGRYEGRGDEAAYDPAAGTIVLEGRPTLVGKDGGTSRADKLTFHRGDGKILIENKGQGRSITIVKS